MISRAASFILFNRILIRVKGNDLELGMPLMCLSSTPLFLITNPFPPSTSSFLVYLKSFQIIISQVVE
jgi:hypothetical protein